MKKISTLVASLFVGMAVFATPATTFGKTKPAPSVSAATRPMSALTIQSSDNADIKVVLDGRRFEPNDNSLRIDNVENGSHMIKIYKEKRNGSFNIFGKKYDVVFNSTITVKPRTSMTISIDRANRISMADSRVRGNGGYDNGGYSNGGWADHNFDYGHGNNAGDYGQGQQGGWDNHSGYSAGMNDREFSAVLQSINKEWLETNKLKSADHVVTSNQLSSAQVKQLVQLFSFESNKLELAKDAYANTVDKRNYTMINDVFSFNSSKDELARFIRNFR
jgi:hypothetical protein